MGKKTGFGLSKKNEVIPRMLDLVKNSGMKRALVLTQICKEYGVSSGTLAYFVKQWSKENEEFRLAMQKPVNDSYVKPKKEPKKEKVIIDNRASARLTNEIGIAKTLELIDANFNRAEVVQWLMQEYKVTYSHIAKKMQHWSLQNERIAEKLMYENGKAITDARHSKVNGLPNPHIGRRYKKREDIVKTNKIVIPEIVVDNPIEEETIISLEAMTNFDPVRDLQQVVKCYAENLHQPSKDELEGLQEYYVILSNRGLNPVLWLTSCIKEVGKKHFQKQNMSYLIGLIRTRMIKGWGISKNEDEEYIITEIEKMLNSELENEQRIKIYQLMGQEGSLRLFAAINKIDIRDMFIANLFEYLRANPRSEIRKALGSDWVEKQTQS